MKLGYQLGIVAALIFLASPSASAAEMAILRNGFAIRHERRETLDTVTRLYLLKAPDNYIDVPTAEIVRFEEVDSPLPPAVRSAPARDLDAVVSAASKRNNLDPDLVNSVILAESGFDPHAVPARQTRIPIPPSSPSPANLNSRPLPWCATRPAPTPFPELPFLTPPD